MHLLRRLLLAASLAALPFAAAAAEFQTIAGHFELSDDFELLERNETPGEDGSPGALYVFKRKADELPRAIYILSISRLTPEADATPAGRAEAAAIVADPTNPSPDVGQSKPVAFGGDEAMRHQTRLANGLHSITYVADHDGLRLLALLKHPDRREYTKDTRRFEEALAGFTWTPVAPAAAVSAVDAPAAEATEAANETVD